MATGRYAGAFGLIGWRRSEILRARSRRPVRPVCLVMLPSTLVLASAVLLLFGPLILQVPEKRYL